MNKNTIIRTIVASVLFIAVLLVSQFCQGYSLIRQGGFSIFLNTPDWYKELWDGPMSFPQLISSFIVQFYDLSLVGPLCTAAIVTGIYLLAAAFLRRVHLPFCAVPAMVVACACWVLLSVSDSPLKAIVVLLVLAALYLLSLLVKRADQKAMPTWELAVLALLIVAGASAVGFSKTVRRTEILSKVEVCARKFQWNKVLQAATPEHVEADRRLMPYALLALNGNGSIGSNLFKYPLEGPQDMDCEGDLSLDGYYFTSILYECLGCPNEAIHNVFQFSCHLPHGTSSVSLKQLIKYNTELGNFTMVRKYAEILSHSPRNRYLAKQVLEMYKNAEDAVDTLGHSSSQAPVITKSPVFNLAQLQSMGNTSQFAVDRLLTYLLLDCDLQSFTEVFNRLVWEGANVPRHYQEAIALNRKPSPNLNSDLAQRFGMLVSAMQTGDAQTAANIQKGTYWGYYFQNASVAGQ